MEDVFEFSAEVEVVAPIFIDADPEVVTESAPTETADFVVIDQPEIPSNSYYGIEGTVDAEYDAMEAFLIQVIQYSYERMSA